MISSQQRENFDEMLGDEKLIEHLTLQSAFAKFEFPTRILQST